MKKSKNSTIVFAYNSFGDPLFQNLVFQYIRDLARNTDLEFHVITFEQKEFSIEKEKRELMQREFLVNGLYWYPQEYAYGPVLLFNKFRNLIDAFRVVHRVKKAHECKNLLCFGNVAAAFGGLLSLVHRSKSIIIQYEPHHLFLLELNRWNRNSLKYRVLANLEEFARKKADHIMTGTSHMIADLRQKNTKAKLYRTPNSVSEDLMKFDSDRREQIRKMLGVEGRDVFVYMGKLGELYYEEELVEICGAIYKQNTKAVFLVITSYDHEVLKNWFEKWGVPDGSVRLLKPVPHIEVPRFLSAADMGIVAIPPTPAQKFRSPLKTADYLYCGLPYLICQGISEDDQYASEYQVGVVMEKFSFDQINLTYPQIDSILKEDKTVVRERCRKIGLEYRNRARVLTTIVEILKKV